MSCRILVQKPGRVSFDGYGIDAVALRDAVDNVHVFGPATSPKTV